MKTLPKSGLFTALLLSIAGLGYFSQAHAGPYYYNEMSGRSYDPGSPNGHGYAGVAAGAIFPNTAQARVDNRGTDVKVDLDGEAGAFGGLKLGWQFPDSGFLKYAIEGELLYSSSGFKGAGSLRGANVSYEGDLKALAIMINGLLRFDLGAFEPYVGLGVGPAKAWVKDSYFLLDDRRQGGVGEISDWGWAWQFMAGGELMLFSDRLGIFTEYKYLSLMSIQQLEEYRQHMLGLGLRVHF